MIRKKEDARLERRSIGGGTGELELLHRLEGGELFGRGRLCAEITLQPGESIGLHKHEGEAEIYLMLSGELVSLDENGGEQPFAAGDIMVTGGGASHAVRNDSGAPATLFAVVMTE